MASLSPIQAGRNYKLFFFFLCTRHCRTDGGFTVVGFLPKVGENLEGLVLGGGQEDESASCVSSAPPVVNLKFVVSACLHRAQGGHLVAPFELQ